MRNKSGIKTKSPRREAASMRVHSTMAKEKDKKHKDKETMNRTKSEMSRSQDGDSRQSSNYSFKMSDENLMLSRRHFGSGSGSSSRKKHRVRDDEKISKQTAESIDFVVADFWETAWLICAERFFNMSAPITVSHELRNCWLRIAEAEWQDRDKQESPKFHGHVHVVFYKDEPPLPLTFDSWARGSAEMLPKQKRESFADPFLRKNYHKDQDVVHIKQYNAYEGMSPPEDDITPSSSLTTIVEGKEKQRAFTIKSIM